MKLIADQKRRVVLPKPAEPGDVFEVIESGDRLVLVKLVRPKAVRPPVAPIPTDPRLLKGIDLDEPAFAPMSNESHAILNSLTSETDRAGVRFGQRRPRSA